VVGGGLSWVSGSADEGESPRRIDGDVVSSPLLGTTGQTRWMRSVWIPEEMRDWVVGGNRSRIRSGWDRLWLEFLG
jgi:hypothetical protein